MGLKLNSFCTAKEIIKDNNIKRQPSEWEKIIANDTADKGLTPKYISSTCSSIPEKQTTQSKKMGRRPKQTFLLRRHGWPTNT